MNKEHRIFELWISYFKRFTKTSGEWDFENYINLNEGEERLTSTQVIKQIDRFKKKLSKFANSFGINFDRFEIAFDSPFYNELNIFGPDWISHNGVVSKLHDVLETSQQHINELKKRSNQSRFKNSSGPKKKLPAGTARAILVGIRMLKMEKQDCEPMRKFLEPNGEFEKLAQEHGTTIEGFRRRQHYSEGIKRWVDGAQDRCIEAILSATKKTTVKEGLKDKKARKDLLTSVDITVRKLIKHARKQ